jgi:hypothetical protein
MTKSITFEEVSKREGFIVEELQKGYGIFSVRDGVNVIEKFDCLDQYGLSKFETDAEAGEQAKKDGLNVTLYTGDDEELNGWYIVND